VVEDRKKNARKAGLKLNWRLCRRDDGVYWRVERSPVCLSTLAPKCIEVSG
jgi:hypothetical protein